MFAFHDPSKTPDFKPLAEANAPTEPENDDLAQAQVRGFFISMALSAKG